MAVALTKSKQKLERGKVSPDALEAMVREVAETVRRKALDVEQRPVAEEVEERPRSLVEFAERFRVGFVPHELHHVIGDTLDHAFRGDCRFCLRPEAEHPTADGHSYGRLDRIIVETPPQVGKALALDTPIATPTGWTTIGALEPGDIVFSDTGDPCRVVAVSPVWEGRPCYAVRTDDGYEIVADARHEWRVNLDRRWADRIHDTERVARTRGKRALVRQPKPLMLPPAELPIDPYVLGVWLGDGNSHAAVVTSYDDEVRAEVGRRGYKTSEQATPHTFGILGLHRALRLAGLLGNKHIPAAYFRGDAQQRRDLVAGLVDTDGYVSPKGLIEFTTTRRCLADGIRELLHTLGIKAGLAEGRATLDGRDCGPKWRVTFYGADLAYLPRKRDLMRNPKKLDRYIDATPTESVPVRCIQVDSPSHMFLAGRAMLPTHNSEMLSVMAPAYYLGEHPDRYWVAASYDKALAERNGRYARDVVESRGFRQHYPLRLDPAKTAAAEWEADGERGGFFGVGVGGGLTGRTGDVIVIDDPIRGRSEADSPAYRKRVWDWWTGTVLARINPRTIIVIVMTRWHHDDLVGRLINGFDDRKGDGGTERGGRWRIVKAPAIATDLDDPLGRQPGEPLMGGPAGVRFVSRDAALDWWHEVETNAGTRDWAALYQQSPGLDEGALFKAGGWGWYDVDRELPRTFAHTIQTFDTAFTEKTMNDACASITAQLDGERIFLRDGWRDRVEFPVLEAVAVALATKWRPTLISVEAKAAGMPLVQSLRKKIRGLKLWDPEKADKVARAFACQPFFEQHRVLLPYHVLADGTRESPPWVAELLQETGEFPQAAHDDYVDALTQLLLEVAAIERRQQRVRQQARRASNVGIDPRYIDTDTKAAPSPEIVRGSRRW